MTEAELLSKIERFAKKHQLTLTEFGLRAVKNGALVTRLKQGKTLTMRTQSRVLSYMQNEHQP